MPTPDAVTDFATALVLRAVRRFRARLLRLADERRRNPGSLQVYDLLAQERRLAESVRLSQLATYLSAARWTAEPAVAALPPVPPDRHAFAAPLFPDDPPRLPVILKAAEWLRTRLDYEPEEFRTLDGDAKQLGFTVARATSLEAVNRVRASLAENVRTGETLRAWKEDAADVLAGTLLSDAQVETVYRTQVGKAYGAGQAAVLAHPQVAPAFPYCLYSATHDARVRPDHLQLERMGLDGGPVYRTDDPFWGIFTPPWAWCCRCVKIPLSLRDAARRGVREAKEWLRTGMPPIFPEYVALPDFRPPPGWVPVGRGIPVAA